MGILNVDRGSWVGEWNWGRRRSMSEFVEESGGVWKGRGTFESHFGKVRISFLGAMLGDNVGGCSFV